MPLSSATVADRATALAATIAEESIHQADPGNTGTSESSAARQPIAATAAAGVVTIPSASFSGGAAGADALWLGLWDSSSNFIASTQASASGDSAFNAAGAADVDAWTITGSAS